MCMTGMYNSAHVVADCVTAASLGKNFKNAVNASAAQNGSMQSMRIRIKTSTFPFLLH